MKAPPARRDERSEVRLLIESDLINDHYVYLKNNDQYNAFR